jgi:hypothetical protein
LVGRTKGPNALFRSGRRGVFSRIPLSLSILILERFDHRGSTGEECWLCAVYCSHSTMQRVFIYMVI